MKRASVATLVGAFLLGWTPPSSGQTPPSSGQTPPSEEPQGTRVSEVPKTVTIFVRSTPRANVRWGARALGTTPLKLERPHDSGPLDLTLTAGGHLTHHIRAFTFKDESLNVRMVPDHEAHTVFGYPQRGEVAPPEPVSGAASAAPPEPATSPASAPH